MLTHSLDYEDIAEDMPASFNTIYLAYSGGVDSHVLLHLLAGQAQLKESIIAVYIDHNLQKESAHWERHCRAVCHDLMVNYRSVRVNARPDKGQSPEEGARNARYQALKTMLKAGDVLLLAQHREDQLETVLLQLFRGAGVHGLGAMAPSMEFGPGCLMRPLLNIPQEMIRQYAYENNLQWVEDPSNQLNDFDRNYLRNKVVPLIKQRWKSVDKTVARAAQNCAAADKVLLDVADNYLQSAMNGSKNRLQIDSVLSVSGEIRNLMLRRWLQYQQVLMPSAEFLHRIYSEVIKAKADADPCLVLQGHQIRRFNGYLYCINEQDLLTEKECDWSGEKQQLHRANGYCLRRIQARQGIPVERWHAATVTVKVRQGGEVLSLPGRRGHHRLKKLFQENKFPVWLRDVVPLIYLNDKLAAVGDLWVGADFYSDSHQHCYQICWEKVIKQK